MKIDLFDFVGVNENTKMLEEEIAFRKELHKLIASIIKGDKMFTTPNSDLIKRLKLKYKIEKSYDWNGIGCRYCVGNVYNVELNEASIKKVQKYLDNEVYDEEDAY